MDEVPITPLGYWICTKPLKFSYKAFCWQIVVSVNGKQVYRCVACIQPNSRTAEQPNSRTAVQPNSRTAVQPRTPQTSAASLQKVIQPLCVIITNSNRFRLSGSFTLRTEMANQGGSGR